MRVIAAYLLAVLSGNEKPSEKDITKILDAVGIKAEPERIKKVIAELQGKDIDALIREGHAKLSSVPALGGGGGGGGGAAAPAAAGGAAKGGKEKEAEPAKKKKEESEEEAGEGDMGFSLFD